jgi:hypothetical protein
VRTSNSSPAAPLLLALLATAAAAAAHLATAADDRPWRPIPLVKDGKVSDQWAPVGWGRFAVEEGGVLRAVPDERGMGLLVYRGERLGDCQVRVVYKPETPRVNSGVYVRVADGILERAGKESVAVRRDARGKLSPEMLERMRAAADAEDGVWYAVHHGYEVQIMDDSDPLHRTGAIYGLAEAKPVPPPEPGADGWRTMVITLDGDRVSVEVDGAPLSTFDPASTDLPPRRQWYEPKRDARRPRAGYVALQAHDPGDVVRFREVSVRPLAKRP